MQIYDSLPPFCQYLRAPPRMDCVCVQTKGAKYGRGNVGREKKQNGTVSALFQHNIYHPANSFFFPLTVYCICILFCFWLVGTIPLVLRHECELPFFYSVPTPPPVIDSSSLEVLQKILINYGEGREEEKRKKGEKWRPKQEKAKLYYCTTTPFME